MSALLYASASAIILAVLLIMMRETIIRYRTVKGTVELLIKKFEHEAEREYADYEKRVLINQMKKVYDQDPTSARQRLAYLRKHPEFLEDA